MVRELTVIVYITYYTLETLQTKTNVHIIKL